jgi:hypothetical protein
VAKTDLSLDEISKTYFIFNPNEIGMRQNHRHNSGRIHWEANCRYHPSEIHGNSSGDIPKRQRAISE